MLLTIVTMNRSIGDNSEHGFCYTNRGNTHLHQHSLDMASLRSATGMDFLPHGFTPGPFDVICARGKTAKNHPGNRRYRHLIEINLAHYDACTSKIDKSIIVTSILDAVRESSPNGGFVRQDEETGRWYEVGDHAAREKIGQV